MMKTFVMLSDDKETKISHADGKITVWWQGEDIAEMTADEFVGFYQVCIDVVAEIAKYELAAETEAQKKEDLDEYWSAEYH